MLKKAIRFVAIVAAAASPLLLTGPAGADGEPRSNQYWWPEKLDLAPLRQHSPGSNPLGDKFNYARAFASLDLKAVKKDIETVLKTPQDWWPADYGNYGPFHPDGLAQRGHLPRG